MIGNMDVFKLIFFFLFVNIFAHNSYAVNIQQFQRSNTLTFEMLDDARISNSHVYNDYDLSFVIGGSWVESPLTIKTQDNSKQLGTVIGDMYGIHLGASVYLSKSLQLGATTTYSFFEDSFGQSKSDLSDLNINLKWRFHTSERNAFAIMPLISLPTGGGETTIDTINGPQQTKILSDDSFGYGGLFVYERIFKKFNFVVNLGYKQSKNAIFDDIDLRKRVLTGAGVYIPVDDTWGVNIEWLRQWSLPFANGNQNPNELYAGLSFGVNRNMAAFAGVGFGNQALKFDGNDLRLSAGLKITPNVWSKKREPIQVVKLDEAMLCEKLPVFGHTNYAVVRFPKDISVIYEDKNLDRLAILIKERVREIDKVELIGHASAPGSISYNKVLSKERAGVIKDYFVKQGVDKKIIQTIGMGESQPLVGRYNQKAHRVNRRVEIKIILKRPPGNQCEGVSK